MAGKTSFPLNVQDFAPIPDRGIVEISVKERKIAFALAEITKRYEFFGDIVPILLQTAAITKKQRFCSWIDTLEKRRIIMSVSAISLTNSLSQDIRLNTASASTSTAASTSTSTSASASTSASTAALTSSSTSTSTSTVSQSTLNQIRADVKKGMTTAQIAQQLGISVATLKQEAAAAGITLNSSSSSTATSGNSAVGNNVDTTA